VLFLILISNRKLLLPQSCTLLAPISCLNTGTVLAAAALLQVFDSSCADVGGSWSGPDEEFGVFAAVYGPTGTEYADQALLAINMGERRCTAMLPTATSLLSVQLNINGPLRRCSLVNLY
jgi:hypothetical protein